MAKKTKDSTVSMTVHEAMSIASLIAHLDEAWGTDGRELDMLQVQLALKSEHVRSFIDRMEKQGMSSVPRQPRKRFSQL